MFTNGETAPPIHGAPTVINPGMNGIFAQTQISTSMPGAQPSSQQPKLTQQQMIERMRMQEKYVKAARYLKCCEMIDQHVSPFFVAFFLF